MKTAIMFLALLTALAAASERSDLEISIVGENSGCILTGCEFDHS